MVTLWETHCMLNVMFFIEYALSRFMHLLQDTAVHGLFACLVCVTAELNHNLACARRYLMQAQVRCRQNAAKTGEEMMHRQTNRQTDRDTSRIQRQTQGENVRRREKAGRAVT